MDSLKSIPQRNLKFDFARAICVLWIVGFWHLINYLPQECRLQGNALTICKEITYGVLACFTFLSGYFLKKYDFNSINDTVTFYKKRLIRFYPLFVLATSCFLVSGSSLRQVLYAIFGLSLFLPPPIATLWYFSMLLFFYLCTPLLKMKESVKMMFVFIAVLIVLFVFGYFFADKRFIMYLPFYILGLNLPNRTVESFLDIYTFILSVAVFVCFCFIGSDNLILQIVQALSGVCAVCSFLTTIRFNDLWHLLLRHPCVPICFIGLYIQFLHFC